MKPIVLSEELKAQALINFKKQLDSARLQDSQINFTLNLSEVNVTPTQKPTLIFSERAYLKILLYVRDTSTEIAWHGTVRKDAKTSAYYIDDVFLYPQTVTGATVQTDQAQYNKWCENLDDDTYNSLRFQGHSHVNFAPTPSATDLTYYNDMLQILPKNEFYIFMIINKSGVATFLIYDLAINTIFETKDINIKVAEGIHQQIEDEKKECCKTVSYSAGLYPSFERYNISSTQDYPKSYTNVDKIFEEMDQKYKNVTLTASTKKKKGAKK